MKQSKITLGQVADADLHLLRVFRAVVRCGGLSAAEAELSIGRSTISRHLKDLEIRLGATLCRRGRSGFALTDEGVRVFDSAERLLTAVSRFRTEVSEVNNRLRGHVQIALFDKTVTNPDAHITQALGDFALRAPEVNLELYVAPTNRIESGVIDGDYQIGIIPTHRNSAVLRYMPLFGEQMYLYCGRNHPLFSRTDQPGSEDTVWHQKYAGLGFQSPNMETGNRFNLTRAAEAHDQEAIATLILSGRFVGFLPQHYAEPFQAKNLLRPLYPDHFQYTCQFAAIVRRSPPPSRLVNIFLNCLRATHRAPAV